MLKSITRRPLWFNILVAIAISSLLFLLFMFSLNWITKHGESKTVPNVTGKRLDQVTKLLDDGGFETIIQDSIYVDSLAPGVVIRQFPEADQLVKVNRTVFVVINRFIPPEITMPNINGFTFRNALLTLNNLGLKLGDTSFRNDFAYMTVMEMQYKGAPLKPGEKIRVGSRVDLVLANGLGDQIKVPNLIGMVYAEAKILLEANGVGSIPVPDADVSDNESAYVYWQNPPSKTPDGAPIRMRSGQWIDVRLSLSKPVADTTVAPVRPEEDY